MRTTAANTLAGTCGNAFSRRAPGRQDASRRCRVWQPELLRYPRLDAAQVAALADDARLSQASCTTSASSCTLSSPIRLARISTDGWPSKCGVVKNGEPSSWTSACLSDSDGTQNMITSA